MGDMSFVGPRPLLPEYMEYYNVHELKRHSVKPGLTGLAQIKFGNSEDWEGRMNADIEYLDKTSFLFDFALLMKTVFHVFKVKQKRNLDRPILRFDEFAKRRSK